MQQESHTGQVAQIRFTADPTTRLSDVRRKARKEPLRNSVTTQPTREEEGAPDLHNSMRASHGKNETSTNILDARSTTSTARCASNVADLHRQENHITEVKTEVVAKTEDGVLKFPNAEYLQQISTTHPRANGWMDEVKKTKNGETVRSRHSNNEANQTCTRQIASNLTPFK